MNKGKIFLVSRKDILGELANWAVRQSPYHRPDNLEVVLDKFNSILPKPEGHFWEISYKQIVRFTLGLLQTIPEFMLWNERKNGNQNPFSFCSRYDQPEPDNDFIDIDALVRNIANSIVRQSCEKGIPEILGEGMVESDVDAKWKADLEKEREEMGA